LKEPLEDQLLPPAYGDKVASDRKDPAAYGEKVASDKVDPAAMVSVAAAKLKTSSSRIPKKKREQLDQGVALGLPKKI
jgi:hypothetical protein